MAKAQIILGELGGGGSSGTCALVHLSLPAASQKNVAIVTQNSANHYYMGTATGAMDISDSNIGTILFDYTITDYGISITITPNKTFNYKTIRYTTVNATQDSDSDYGVLTQGVAHTFYAYYYNTSASRPQTTEILLWE